MANETDKVAESEVIWEWSEYRIVRRPRDLGLSPEHRVAWGWEELPWHKMPAYRIANGLVQQIADLESQAASTTSTK